MYAVYILICADNSYYTGLSNDLDKRVWQHETGYFPECYTFNKRPIKLAWNTIVETAEEAAKLEKQIKGWSRKKKEALIKGDIDELKKLSNKKKTKIEERNNIISVSSLSSSSPSSSSPSSSSGVDFLLIGQGICGTWLSFFLEKAGYSFIIIDEASENSASKIAAGIINPVTGRRIVKTWMIDELLPIVRQLYSELGSAIGVSAIEQKNIIDFFPSPQMKLAFTDRLSKDSSYLSEPADENSFRSFFTYDFGYGEIQPCYLINLPAILPSYRNRLFGNKTLIAEHFDFSQLSVSVDSVRYKNIIADKIIFCDGIAASQNPYFKNLPFAPNKGEALWIEAPALPDTHIFKKGMNVVPWSKNIFWVGSSYEWEFENNQPTDSFRERTNRLLKFWLKVPFKIIDHKASVRPATIERRPFIGFHPAHPSVGIFNGMGTKGCSLAPYFAKQWVQQLIEKAPVHAEADISRFARVLARP